MTTDTTIDATGRGDLVPLTAEDIDQVSGGIIPLIIAAGAFVAANAEFFICVGAGAGVVGAFWYSATHSV